MRLVLAAAVALSSVLWSTTALAGAPVDLKSELDAPGGVVTLGDLFDGAGAAARVRVAAVPATERSMVLDAGEVQQRAHMAGLDWDNPNGYRRLVVTVTPSDSTPPQSASVRGARTVQALTYARSLAAGETVRAEDVLWARVQAHLVPGDAPRDPSDIIGEVTKKPLAEGAVVATHDLGAALVIKRDQIISVAYATGGVRLVLQGRALADAHLGEAFQVLNTQSKKIIEAVASGPGEALAGPEAESLKTRSFASLR